MFENQYIRAINKPCCIFTIFDSHKYDKFHKESQLNNYLSYGIYFNRLLCSTNRFKYSSAILWISLWIETRKADSKIKIRATTSWIEIIKIKALKEKTKISRLSSKSIKLKIKGTYEKWLFDLKSNPNRWQVRVIKMVKK